MFPAWRYVTTNQGTLPRSRFRPARPLAPSSRAPAPSVAPLSTASFRPCPCALQIRWAGQGRPPSQSRKTPPAQPYRIPHRHFWAPWSQPHRSPGGLLPVTHYTTERRLPRARPVVVQLQRPRLRFATAPAPLVPRRRLARRGFARPQKNRPKAACVHSQFTNHKFTSLPKSHPFRGRLSYRPR